MSSEVATEILRGKVDELKAKIKADKELAFILSLNSVASDILIAMAYQLGISGLKGFKKMLSAFRAGDYALASREMLNSRWAKQTPNRAKRASEVIFNIA